MKLFIPSPDLFGKININASETIGKIQCGYKWAFKKYVSTEITFADERTDQI